MTFGALEIPETLHEILDHLPQKDLLLVQRVCRQWHTVINASKVLQEALFLRPSSQPLAPDSGLELNPLLKSKFPAFFDNRTHVNQVMKGPHNLGPWDTTDWVRGTPPTANTVPIIDPVRSAAYSR